MRGKAESTVYDIIYRVGVNIDPHCFDCKRKDCKGVCEYAHDPKQSPHKRRPAKPNAVSASEYYKRTRENGMCIRCKKAPALDGKCMCAECRDITNAQHRERRRKARERMIRNDV